MELGRGGHPAEGQRTPQLRGFTPRPDTGKFPEANAGEEGGGRPACVGACQRQGVPGDASRGVRIPGSWGRAGRPAGAERLRGGGSPGISRSGENAEPDAPSPEWGSRGLCPPRGPPRAAQVTGAGGWVLEGPSKPVPRPSFLGPPASFLVALDPCGPATLPETRVPAVPAPGGGRR